MKLNPPPIFNYRKRIPKVAILSPSYGAAVFWNIQAPWNINIRECPIDTMIQLSSNQNGMIKNFSGIGSFLLVYPNSSTLFSSEVLRGKWKLNDPVLYWIYPTALIIFLENKCQLISFSIQKLCSNFSNLLTFIFIICFQTSDTYFLKPWSWTS